MNHGTDFDRENEKDRKRRLAEQKKRAKERETRKRLETAAPKMFKLLKYMAKNGWSGGVQDEAEEIVAAITGKGD